MAGKVGSPGLPVRITRDFEFIFSIGEGSFGKVWKARNQTDKCYYALKEICIAKALLKIGNNLNGLFEEVHVLQLLNHPNIVRYHTSWLEGPKSEEIKNGSLSFAEDMSSTDTNLLLIQMELCESTLKCVLRNSVFNLEIPPLFCQLSEALHFIHDHNIIHRDIKPDNIFLSGNLWKIGDFGLARLFTDNSTLSTAGCSAYQSPDPGCSKKSDVFTLGLVFLEVLHAISTKAVGTFPTVKYKEILRAIQPSFRQECAIISKMLRQDKDERVSSGQVKWEFSGLYDYRKMPDFIVNVNPGNNIPDGVSGDYSNETGTGEEALFNEIEIQAPTTPQSNINEENNITQQLTKTQGEQVNQLLALLQSTSRQEDSVIPSEKSFLEFPNPVTNFTGRSSLMDDVIKSLTSWSTNLKHQINFPLVNLYGLGGHGKTQTAQAVAVTCIEDEHFDAEIWIDAEKEEEIMQKMTLELKNQCIEKIPENEGILLANKFYNLISSKGSQKILVIFDNVEGFYEVQNFLPLNKNMENVAILLTSVEMVTISSEKGKSDNYRVDVLEEDEAKELFTTILKDSVDYTESDLSLLVEESGKIPIIICMMAGTIASGGSKSSITQLIRRWKEFSDKILRYPKTPKRSKTEKEKKKKSSDEYEKSLYVCVKIALEYLKQSTDKYASVALHIIEKCAYFHNNCPLKYILEHVTTIKQDIEEVISEELLLPLEPDQVLKNAIELLSRFSLISFRTINYSKIEMKAEIHRLVHGTLILIQKDENREETILEDLIGCEDYPELSGSITCAVIWSHAANHDRLIRKYFMEKGSFKGLVQHGFLNEVKKIIKTLGESDSASRILQPERIGYKKINGLESALENDFKGLGREFVRLLKTNRTHICDDVWNTGIKTTLIFCLQRLNLEVFTYLVDELALDVNFLSSSRGMYRTDNLLVISSASGKLDVATYLLSKNVDPFIKGDHGNSALHALATVWEEKQEVIFLASQIVSTYPALLYGKNIDGELAFMTAAKFGCPNYLNSLLDNMEDASEQINCTDNKGNTAVMLAIENCQQRPMSEVIAVLVKYGANIHYVNTMKLWNAWHYATRSAFGFTKPKDFRLYFVLKTLVRHNVDPEFQDGNGDTFFHAIMKRCTFESIDENTVIDILEFIVANNMCKIFDCENGDGLSVMKLAEKLKDPPSKCSEDETSSISSDEESLHEGLIENLDIVIGFIRRLKGNHLNLESTLCERIETQNPPNIQKTTIIETNAFLPFPKPYKNFAGRTRLCDDVIKYLTSQVLNSVAQIRVPLVNLYGPSGYGKTQIALKIAERCSMEALFSDIIWIDADNESRIKEKVWRELHNQGIPNIQGNRGIFLINKLYDLIESRNPNKVLVIFDDIDGFDEIKNYLPLNRNVNLVILLISENEVVFPPEYEEICTFEVDIFDEDDAKELVAKQLNGSPDYKENEISLLLSESGRIPIILSIMTGIIATVGRKYSMSKILHEIEAEKQSKIPRCSKNRNTQDDFSSQCDELMYVCMKIVIKKLEESTNEYAVMAIKFLERCGYFNNICSLKFILDKVPSIMQDSEKISDESPFPIEPKQMLIRSVKLMSKFSLVDYVAGDDPYVIIHPRVQSSIRHIQQEEQREHDILKELISCEDLSEYGLDIPNAETYFIRSSIATLWSHALGHENLIRKYFPMKASMKTMIEHGFFNDVKIILELLEDDDSAIEILNLEYFNPFCRVLELGVDLARSGLESALENDFAGLGKYMIRQLKDNQSDIEEQVWDDGLSSALFFSLEFKTLEVMTALVEGLALDDNFLSRVVNEDKNTLLLVALDRKQFKIAEYLLDKNANPCITGKHGYNALHLLGIKWNKHNVESPTVLAAHLVSKYPSLIHEKDDAGNLPFMKAAEFLNESALKFLLTHMTDATSLIDYTNKEGDTALMLAIQNTAYYPVSNVIQILMSLGANIYYTNKDPEALAGNAWEYGFCSRLVHKTGEPTRYGELFKILIENKVSPKLSGKPHSSYAGMVTSLPKSVEYVGEMMVIEILNFMKENDLDMSSFKNEDCSEIEGAANTMFIEGIIEIVNNTEKTGNFNVKSEVFV